MKVTCSWTGKQAYGTIDRALRDADRALQSTGLPFRIYKCDKCGCFHLTSKPWQPRGAR